MLKEDTFIVTEENGPRPAGKPDQCFYCHQKLGQPHATDCVCRKKTVVVQAVVTYVLHVPAAWDTLQVENHRNDSSWCASNFVDEMIGIRDSQIVNEDCLCENISFTCLRDATSEDEENLAVVPRDP